MIKIFYQGDQDELLGQCAGRMTNLVRTDGLYKQASSACFSAQDMARYAPDKDHFMMHAVAMGAYPRYLPNRNGDAFTRDSLMRTHDTFVKFAKFYREHQHDDPTNNIGFVKASAYNEDLDRVELLIHGHKRNAEEEYEMAKQGKELSVSMAGRMKYDQCSICDNKSREVEHYCDHLKNNMNQYMPEFRKYAFAMNPEPKFFDISRVRRPADRIAHYLEYVFGDAQDSMTKAASEVSRGGIVIPGAMWAKYEGFMEEHDRELPDEIQKLAQALADKETWYQDRGRGNSGSCESAYMEIVKRAAYDPTGLPPAFEQVEPSVMFRKLARACTVMPFDLFCSYLEGKDLEEVRKDPEFLKSSSQMPFLFTHFNKLQRTESLQKLAASFSPASEYTVSAMLYDGGELERATEQMERGFSMRINNVRDRALSSFNKQASNKDLTMDPTHVLDKMATAYACYQLQTLFHSNAGDVELLGVVGQNRFKAENS